MNTEEDTGSTQVYRYDVASDIWIELENFKTGRYKVSSEIFAPCMTSSLLW